MKVQVVQSHVKNIDTKGVDINLFMFRNPNFKENYERLISGFGKEKFDNSLSYLVENNSSLFKIVAEVDVENISDVFKMTNNIEESWHEILPEGSKYYGHPDGCKSTSVGDMLIVDGKEVFVYKPSSLDKANDELAELVIKTIQKADYSPQRIAIDDYLNDISEWKYAQDNGFKIIQFNRLETQLNDWLYEMKLESDPRVVDRSELQMRYLSNKIAKDSFDSGIVKPDLDKFNKDLNIELGKLENLSRDNKKDKKYTFYK